ncbi:MAG TPA: DNA polymerase III subunit beta [Gemmataceae bacterium]|nr:DNA polymerase III subunit beta [Gemmataceae bacterium]
MKAIVNREAFLSACQLASVATAARDVKPILQNFKAIVEADRCTLMATDLELGIRLEVRSVKVEEPGEAIIPAGRMTNILRESTDSELVLESSTDKNMVRGQFNEFEMPGEDPANFPDIPSFEEEKYHEVASGVLREMIRRTQFAVAVGEARFSATTGILVELENDQAKLVATDGRRLALAQGPAKAHGDHSTKGQMPVVPGKALNLLERNLHEAEEIVRIAVRPNEVLMKTDRAMIYSRLVEGRFPPYQQVIPQKHPLKVPLVVGPFMTAVRQAAVMTDDESKRVVFAFAKHKLTLQAHGTEAGRSKVELPVGYDGKAIEISFDPKFLLDMLKVLDAETALTLELLDGNKPAVFRNDSGNYLYVVVPLAVKESA